MKKANQNLNKINESLAEGNLNGHPFLVVGDQAVWNGSISFGLERFGAMGLRKFAA